MPEATGTFEVKLLPMTPDGIAGDPLIGWMSIEKQFQGGLEGVSQGEMIGARTAVKGSAGYVAMERVSGSLGGRTGTFVLQHNGTMTRGTLELSVTVVPDSGTGELSGLEGRMRIDIAGGAHSYVFEYRLG